MARPAARQSEANVWVGVADGAGTYVEINGGQTSEPPFQFESGEGGYGGYVNSDGDHGQC